MENREGQLFSQTAYAYNSLDWLTGTSTQTKDATTNVSYDYDENGAQISQTMADNTTAQKWDFEGHLLASGAVNAQGQWSGAKTTYSYDASGMRLTQASWNAAGVVTDGTSYVWDGDRVAEERDEKGMLQAVYEHGQELGPLRLVRRAGTIAAPVEQERYFIGDGQDSTRQLLDENGAVKDSYFYDSFGVGLPGGQGATENSFKYTGQQQDASGLYYLRARYYNAGTGRFLSQDPVMGSAEDPISMHRYLYAGDDPVNMVDPTGREYSLAGLGVATGIGATLGGIGGGVASYALTGRVHWQFVAAGAVSGAMVGAALYGGAWAATAYLGPYAPLVIRAYTLGFSVAGIAMAMDVSMKVASNPNSTDGQLAAASSLLAASVVLSVKGVTEPLPGISLRSALGSVSEGGTNQCIPDAIAVDRTIGGRPTQSENVLPEIRDFRLSASTAEEGDGAYLTEAITKATGIDPAETPMKYADLKQMMLNLGEGARAIVVGNRTNGISHSMNVATENGEFIMGDAKNGVYDFEPDFVSYDVWWTHVPGK